MTCFFGMFLRKCFFFLTKKWLLLFYWLLETLDFLAEFPADFAENSKGKSFSYGFCQELRFPGNTIVGNYFMRILSSAGNYYQNFLRTCDKNLHKTFSHNWMSFSARVTFSANKIAATSTTNTAGKSGNDNHR